MSSAPVLSNQDILMILNSYKNAFAVYTQEDIVIENANDAMIAFWGKDRSVIGKPLLEAVPELHGQPFIKMLQEVLRTGIDNVGESIRADLAVDGKLQSFYFDYEYRAVKNEAGETYAIFHTASDVTDRVTNLAALEEAANAQIYSRNRVQALNEELSAINEELSESQERMQELYQVLQVSESRLDQILSELPAPVVVLQGPEQVITTTNESLLRFWNRTKEQVIGKPMLEVFPELRNQPFPAQWNSVLETGIPITNREKPVKFKTADGGERLFYVDYYYQALLDAKGERTSVLATVIDVTDKVESRVKIEEAEAKLRLAIESSELGTWHIDAQTRAFLPSVRLKEIFGFTAGEEMNYEQAMEQISEEHRPLVHDAVNLALEGNENFDLEYSILNRATGQLRWVRGTGKLYNTGELESHNFSGTVQDITEKKLEEQRKDDFLSIASHELKTPITTLKGSLQLLERFRENLSHPMVPKLIGQASSSVSKITGLIDDLLNTTRTNEGQLHLNKSFFNVAEMLKNCCQHIRIDGKYELVIKGDTSVEIFADEQRIDQVIVNFVNNATKYAPKSNQINLIIEPIEDQVKISVQDFGPGIPEDKLPHLFDRYYRADYGGAQYSGLGLGLYISAEIVKRHGGEIGVESKLGYGSTFWFSLPIIELKESHQF